MRHLTTVGALLISALGLDASAQQTTLDIYWIDVEGGAATLIVTPDRQSVLMDAGYEGERDANRIQAAMEDAGVEDLDYFIASHFHQDHVGGLPDLAGRVPIKQFIDHGDSVEQGSEGGRVVWDAYLSAAKGNRRSIVPGDELSLDGVEFTFVTSNGEIPRQALGGHGPNSYCADAFPGEDDSGENSRSVGYLLSLGEFQFLNLGDLTVNVQHELACPEYLLSVVDIFQVPHHGNGVAPQLTAVVNPGVAVLNNGPRKGGSPEGFDAIKIIPDLEAVWQLHRALDTDDDHNAAAEMTANPTEEGDSGYWIKAVVQADGSSYTVINGRNRFSQTYTAR